MTANKKRRRIGVYAGTFDPVHMGHIAFALQAAQAAELDEVVFLPERLPRRKVPAEHYAHRVAMLKRATRPYPAMSVLELADKRFSVRRTWPQLTTIFPSTELVLIVGSDVLTHMLTWPLIDSLLGEAELLVGVRGSDEPALVRMLIASWAVQPKRLHVIASFAPKVSSTQIRRALVSRRHITGLLASVRAYSRANWLYISVGQAVRRKVDKR